MDEKRIEAAAKAIAKVMYAHKDWNLLNIATQNISRNYARAAAPILFDDRVREAARVALDALWNIIYANDLAFERNQSLKSWKDSDFRREGDSAYHALKRALAGEGEQASPADAEAFAQAEREFNARETVPEASVPEAQGVVERVCEAYGRVALAAAREHDRVYTWEQVEKAIIHLYCYAVGNHSSASEFAANIRKRLLPEQERVTVTCDLTGEQQHFIVHLDGKVEINFARELHANRYAAGLRAEIGGKA